MGAAVVSRALTKRAPTDYPAGCVGRLRRDTDREHAAVAAFVDRHPEYARLSHLELATLAATYRGPERDAEVDALEDAGVPLDWHRTRDADDFYDEALA